MNRTLLFGSGFIAASLFVGGCGARGPSDQVALSTDGKLLARTGERGLFVRDVDAQKGRLVLDRPFLNGPRFSPDRKLVVSEEAPPDDTVNVNGKQVTRHHQPVTWIAQANGRRATKLAVHIAPPFAWSPDGKRLLGWTDESHGKIVDVRTGRVTAQLTFPNPIDAAWLPSGGFVLAGKHIVEWRQGGRTRTFSVQAQTVLSVSAAGEKLTWIEGEPPKGLLAQDDYDDPFRVASVNLKESSKPEYSVLDKVSRLVGGPTIASDLSISPTGHRLAFATGSPQPGELFYQALALEALREKDPKNKELNEQIKQMEAKLKFVSIAGTLDLKTNKVEILQSHVLKEHDMSIGVRSYAWSGNGRVLAYALDDRSEIRRYPAE